MTLTVNGRLITEVIIDSHYEQNHPDMNDPLILELVKKLNGNEYKPGEVDEEWEFYAVDRLDHDGKQYRLVWCMKEHSLFIGVINAFRRG
ncbi:MAG: hypothetical protein HYR96_03835 [Deltaproteobacteria bacterium]|nr:hypothetical protein [Deltaproteobacteria bacterium]MBI3295317.1 hypothetical protein [Deltaproteobacteria bacterium]